jgi:hypothetical protein
MGELVMAIVTDPKLLEQLNSSSLKPVTDPALLAQLNATPAAPAKPTFGQTMSDIVQSAPTKLAQGVAGVVGLPGDIAQGVKIAQYALDPNYKDSSLEPWNVLPTSKKINEKLATALGGYKEPTTTAGKYSGAALSFIPSAVSGTGSVGKRIFESAASGMGSEAGGQLAKGTFLETPARIAGALATGAGSAIVKNAKAISEAEALLPTVEGLKTQASNLFDAADKAGLIIDAKKFKQSAVDLKNTLANEGIDKDLHPSAFAAMNRILGTNGNVTLKGVETLRRIASDATTTINKADRRMARIVVDHVDDFVKNLKPQDTMGVDPTSATQMLSQARELWAKASKADTIETLIQKAKNNANGVLGFEDAVRGQFRKLADNARGMARYSAEEQNAIKKVAEGEPIQNVQRLIGKFAPTNPLTVLGSLGAAALNPFVLAVPAAGAAGKIASTLTANKNANAVSQIVRGLVNPKTAPVLDRRALLAAQMANQQGQTQ